MNELLAQALDAHGGLERWNALTEVRATFVTGGELWGLKGLIQDPDPREMTVAVHREQASVAPFGEPDWHTAFTPDRVAIESSAGAAPTGARSSSA